MKLFSVCWKDPNNDNKMFHHTCYELSSAKQLMKEKIKEGMTDVSGSITKVWANGDWEPCGKIQLKGSNKTFVANTRQEGESYK